MRELLSRLVWPWIFQGGMGVKVSMRRLVSAVCNAGGVGILSAAGLGFGEGKTADFFKTNAWALEREIRETRKLTDGIFGVNIMFVLTNFYDLLKVCIKEEVPLVFIGAGFCPDLPLYLKGTKTKAVIIVSSGKAARIICKKYWRDYGYLPYAFVIEGPEAGGHLGFKVQEIDDPAFSLEKILIDVLSEVRVYADKQIIPVIAAGGVYTGADAKRLIDLGADGVQIATRLVPTEECDVHINFKMAYVNAKKEDLVIIRSPVGLPGRAIQSQFLRDVAMGLKKPPKCICKCITSCNVVKSDYCIVERLDNAANGNLSEGFVFAGANAWRTTKIGTVPGVLDAFRHEYSLAT